MAPVIPVAWYLIVIPGTFSALSSASLPYPPSWRMESETEGGVQATGETLSTLWFVFSSAKNFRTQRTYILAAQAAIVVTELLSHESWFKDLPDNTQIAPNSGTLISLKVQKRYSKTFYGRIWKAPEVTSISDSFALIWLCDSLHCEEVSPAGVACNPRDARVKGVRNIPSPTNDQLPPRQEREAGHHPRLRQVRDEAGIGGRAREQFHAWYEVIVLPAANHHLHW